ncbi:MAG: TrkA family potassium uptake protein [Actinobacteria bacterium]|nr:TrkA family potassium uptake protein [Actinomycetota bacterium]
MKVIVVGSGWVGQQLIDNLLQKEDMEVVVIDNDPMNLNFFVGRENCRTVLGHGTDEVVLKLARIEEVDAFAAVTNDDCINIMASLIAKDIYNIKNVVARVYDPELSDIFFNFGLRTICPTTLGASQIKDALLSEF